MATEGPSWADQWGAGGIGSMDGYDDATTNSKDDANEKKKKKTSSSGLGRAKAAAKAGVRKVKHSMSMSIKWVKNKCHRKTSSR